jgi:hypothetical protein
MNKNMSFNEKITIFLMTEFIRNKYQKMKKEII